MKKGYQGMLKERLLNNWSDNKHSIDDVKDIVYPVIAEIVRENGAITAREVANIISPCLSGYPDIITSGLGSITLKEGYKYQIEAICIDDALRRVYGSYGHIEWVKIEGKRRYGAKGKILFSTRMNGRDLENFVRRHTSVKERKNSKGIVSIIECWI